MFLRHLFHALHKTWEASGVAPQTPGAYSAYMFDVLSRAAALAGMNYRGHGRGGELLFDGLWLHQGAGRDSLPQVVIEHENGTSDEHVIYDLRKLMMAWAPVRVMICYAPRGYSLAQRITELEQAIAARDWTYPDGCEDLVLVGPFFMDTPRDYTVLHRPEGTAQFRNLGYLDAAASSPSRSPGALLDEALEWLFTSRSVPPPLVERDLVRLLQHWLERRI